MEEEEYYTEDAHTYLTLCGIPTAIEGLKFGRDLILSNIVLRLFIQYTSLPPTVIHILAILIGSLLLYSNVGAAFFWCAILAMGSYSLMIITSLIKTKLRGLLLAVAVIMFLLSSEFFVINPKMWQQIRGVQMIAAMKIISVAVDMERGVLKRIPNPAEFGGYIMSPANCILGPWIPLQKYNQYMERRFLKWKWLKLIIIQLAISVFCLFLSNCFVPWYASDESHKWLIAYRDAQAFRTSHYFVSIMSQVSMISAGFGVAADGSWEVQVTKPYFIEIPRSLVQVVVYWNIPMHQWLKSYVFKYCQPYGQFLAIYVTYAVSSLLHGLNFQLSAVLLSIGTFSYVEYKIRSKIASIFSMCCLVNPCPKNCTHESKALEINVRLVNIFFSLLAMMHLAYLGVMFEASFTMQETGYSFTHTLSKWAHLDYVSHIIVAFTYFIHVLI